MRDGVAVEKAIRDIDRLTAGHPENTDLLIARAHLRWAKLGDGASAARDLKAVLRVQPENVTALANLAELYRRSGDRVRAAAMAERCLALSPRHLGAMATLVRTRPEGVGEAHVAALHDQLAKAAQRVDRAVLNNLIGQVLDARGAYDAAFAHFAASNRDNPNRHDRAAIARLEQTAIAAAEADPQPPAASRKRQRPMARHLFIVGMPRSGSTLCEQVLLGAPRTASLGESGALRDILATRNPPETRDGDAQPERSVQSAYSARIPRHLRGAATYTDKMPLNFFHLGAIMAHFERAHVVHTTRHPLDTCLSCFSQAFATGNGYSNDLGDLAHFFRVYFRVMDRWIDRSERLSTLRYERLVAAPEATSRALADACGLEWTARSIAPQLNRRVILTSSGSQANAAIHDRSIGRWRNYATQLAPLIDALGGPDAIDAMDRALSRRAL